MTANVCEYYTHEIGLTEIVDTSGKNDLCFVVQRQGGLKKENKKNARVKLM